MRKVKNRILATILAVALGVSSAPFNVGATESTTENVVNVESSEGTATATDADKLVVEENVLSNDKGTNSDGSVTLNAANFPDEEFRAWLSDNCAVTSTSSGELTIKASTIKELDLRDLYSEDSKRDLTGLEYFTNLEILDVNLVSLKSLDVSKNTKLKELYAEYCDLTSLDISNNTSLQELWCAGNTLSKLDTSKNTELKTLYCFNCGLPSLDVSKNIKLEDLECGANKLKTLDVSKCTELTVLECEGNLLTSLDTSKNTKLKVIYSSYNLMHPYPFLSEKVGSATAISSGTHTNSEGTSMQISVPYSLGFSETHYYTATGKLYKLTVPAGATSTVKFNDTNADAKIFSEGNYKVENYDSIVFHSRYEGVDSGDDYIYGCESHVLANTGSVDKVYYLWVEDSSSPASFTVTSTAEDITVTSAAKDITVSYKTHIQSKGWEKDWLTNGATSGTVGSAKRLEAIDIKVSGDYNLGIQYTTHCQSYGWLPWSSDGGMSGTEGEAKRLEAIKIQLTGADKDLYDVYYRVHAQSYGWLNWAKNGEPAGTAGYAKRLEAIQIVVVKKGESIDVNMGGVASKQASAYISNSGASSEVSGSDTTNVAYRTHVQSYGWQGWKYNGKMSGTSGEAKRLEGIKIQLTNKQYSGGIKYRTHVQTYGWEKEWRSDGAMSGTSGEAKRLEAIQIELTGEMAEHYDVYYRVHAQSYGWLGWAKNGESAGTAGYAKRLEGIQIVLVPKGESAPAASYGGVTSKLTTAYISK